MFEQLTQRFVDALQVAQPPVGLTFVEQLPEGIAHMEKRVPSACTFWRLAEQGVFYAGADDHQECPIGMMTMGFTMPASAQERAQGLVETMASVQYFSPAEVGSLPVVQKPHQYIVYGRLDQLPLQPDVVLCVVNPQQAMLIAEALGQVDWSQGGQAAFGRPTCGAVSRTMQSGASSMSFACVGARTYMNLSPAELLFTIPGDQFAGLVEHLETIASANDALAPYHQQQKIRFGAL